MEVVGGDSQARQTRPLVIYFNSDDPDGIALRLGGDELILDPDMMADWNPEGLVKHLQALGIQVVLEGPG